MSNSKQFTKDSVLTISRQITGVLLGLLLSVIIARELGKAGSGMYALIILLPTMLVAFLNLGVGTSTVYYLGKRLYSLTTIIRTNIISALLLSAISIVFGLIFLITIYPNTSFRDIPIHTLYGIIFTVPILFLNEFSIVIFQGKNDFRTYNTLALSRQIASLLTLVVCLYLLNLGLFGAVLSFAIGAIFQLLLTIFFLKTRLNIQVWKGSFSKEYFGKSLKFGLKAHFSNMLAFVNYRADTVVIKFFSTNAAVGLYNIAVTIAERLWIVSQSISTVLFPKVASLKDEDEKKHLTSLVSRFVLWFSIIAGIAFYFASDLVISILYGEEFKESAVILKVLLPGIVFFSVDRILSSDLAGRGKPELNMYTSLFTVIGNIVLNILLVPKYGVYGAAFSTSLTYSLSTLIKIFIYKSLARVSFRNILFIQKEDILMLKTFVSKIKMKA